MFCGLARSDPVRRHAVRCAVHRHVPKRCAGVERMDDLFRRIFHADFDHDEGALLPGADRRYAGVVHRLTAEEVFHFRFLRRLSFRLRRGRRTGCRFRFRRCGCRRGRRCVLAGRVRSARRRSRRGRFRCSCPAAAGQQQNGQTEQYRKHPALLPHCIERFLFHRFHLRLNVLKCVAFI